MSVALDCQSLGQSERVLAHSPAVRVPTSGSVSPSIAFGDESIGQGEAVIFILPKVRANPSAQGGAWRGRGFGMESAFLHK